MSESNQRSSAAAAGEAALTISVDALSFLHHLLWLEDTNEESICLDQEAALAELRGKIAKLLSPYVTIWKGKG